MFEQEAAGRHYRVTEVRRALFPTSSGQVRIEPAELTIPGESFSRDTVLRSTPVAVNVRPLPEGAPDGFTGAVGQFEISAWVAPEQASLNEATTLYVRVAGTGNLATLPDPSADAENLLTNWRAYETQITTTVDQDGDIIRGEKVFERLLVPKLSGDLVIPSLHLAFFDTEAGSYRHISSDAIEIPITPAIDAAPGVAETDGGEQDVIVHRGDVRHIKAAPPSLSAGHTRLLEQPAYWLAWIVPLVAVFSVWTWERRQRRLSSDTAYIRAQNAQRRARKHLTTAGQLVGKDDVAAHAVVARIIYDYLGDILDMPPPGLTRDAIRCGLSAKSVPDDVIDRTSRCLDWVDSGQFAPSAAGTNVEELIAEIESVIDELEKTARSQ
jgi:hypothetical protein